MQQGSAAIYDFLTGTIIAEAAQAHESVSDATSPAEPSVVTLVEDPIRLSFSDTIRDRLPIPAVWSIPGTEFRAWSQCLLEILDSVSYGVVARFSDLVTVPSSTVVTGTVNGEFSLLLRLDIPFKAVIRSQSLKSFFPYPEPRPGQIEYAQEIVDAFQRGYSDVILQGPCGSGKSAIAMTVARYLLFKELQSGFVATPLKTLQNQYGNDPYFVDHLAVVKGRSAYKCAVSGTHSPACSCKGKKARDLMRATCKSQGICTYYNAIARAQNHPLVLHNMASLIFQCAPLGFYFDSRDLLILDECHCAEDNLLEMFGFTFNQKFCDKYKFQVGMPSWGADGATEPTYEEVLQWLEGAQKSLVTYRAHNENHMTEAEDKTITNRLGNMSLCLRNPEEWVADLKPDEMIFKPLDVSKKADLIYGKARYRLWMSATILGKENFARSMGLSPKKCHYIEAPSTFPAVNRPIYAMECFGIRKLNRDKLDAEMPKLIDAIDAIIDQYPQEKGLIHAHTYKILHALINNSKHRHRMRFHDSTNREDVLGDFLRSPDNDILVSPSMVEGIDLKDDLGRFQILCKIPWPYLGDAQIRALKEHRDGWYLWKTSLEVVQACGRIVRHDTDWGHTYVLDPDFRRWFSNAKELLPDYFKRSVKFVKEF